MIKIFVISLKNAIERRKSISNQMQKLGIDFEFFDAVDGRELTQGYVDSVFDKETAEIQWKPMNRGEIGCSLSHMSIYEKMINENIQNAIVLEDDAVLNDDFMSTIEKMITTIPNNIDMVKLGYGKAKCRWWQKKYRINTKYKINRMYGVVSTTVGYYITVAGAKKILNKNKPKIVRAIDDITGDFLFGGHELYAINPPLVNFLQDESTIGYKGDEDTNHNAIYLSESKRFLIRHFGFSENWLRMRKRKKLNEKKK